MTLVGVSPNLGEDVYVVHVGQGEFVVSERTDIVLTTILGSCVSVCLRDAVAGVGGLNHFLLPNDASVEHESASRYGVHAMELLINGLLQNGARRDRLEAKLFGGAKLLPGLADVGGMNADFAEAFLEREAIPCVGGSLRGTQARRIQYWPVSGRARQFLLGTYAEPPSREKPKRPPSDGGDVEFF